jgi:hypothetical protein
MLLLLLLGLPALVAMALLRCAAVGLMMERKDPLTRELSITGFFCGLSYTTPAVQLWQERLMYYTSGVLAGSKVPMAVVHT